ncbi:mitochondrial ribonuclease P catalytic subunit isoform X2 [Centropristis striata]|uniref:mitochondrial ribonuclease P catalytic subunit isoform X2 n=1 Tax=Centropristis striata TaxID=184440 RepID=UPI0027DEEF00|nr:mitochondrial ribonuclease P catalytic subunit isoform X2 [Centropristis striata]
MASTFILNVRICLKPFKPFFHQGSSAFSTLNTSLCKSPQLPLSARFLCTRDNNPNSGGRQTDWRNRGWTDRQGGVKNSTIRHREEELWDGSVKGRGKSSIRRQLSLPTSVFAAGTAAKTREWLSRRATVALQDVETEGMKTRQAEKMQPPDRPLSVTEWRELKESLGNQQRFEIYMMYVLLKTRAELDIAKSLLTFVAMESGTLPYQLLLRYLTLCVKGRHDAEVFDLYDIMRERFPSLDKGACTLFIEFFSRTAKWRECISILNEIKKVYTPKARNYDRVITAALSNGEVTTAWAMYADLLEQGLSPFQETWDSLFKGVRTEAETMSQSEHQERLLQIILYMRNNQIYPQQSLASTIKTWFESLTGQKWTGSWTRPTPQGVCGCCGFKLESMHLTAEEYQQLRDRVMTDVIQGPDVFKKTTQQELERFKEFVEKKPAFDVVVDGLNVAYNNGKDRASENLLAVVSELEQKAHCFFTESISEDDPFLLYATLHSGNHCRFVSSDLMRNHKACLPKGEIRQLFFKWQRGHQLVLHEYFIEGGRVIFQSIPSYDTIVQNSADSWHLPYDDDTEDRAAYEVPQRWLCLTSKH